MTGSVTPPGRDPRELATAVRQIKTLNATVAVASVVLAIALGVSILEGVRPNLAAPEPSPSAPLRPSTADADRALCTAIAPLMGEEERTTNAWLAASDPESPGPNAALPKYRTNIEDWASRALEMLNAHQGADPFFTGTLQRFIDDRMLLARTTHLGFSQPRGDEALADAKTAYSGPSSVCAALGITW